MNDIIDLSITEHIKLAQKINYLKDDILYASKIIYALKETNNKLLICGNGGSASDSQHLASELVGRFEKNRQGFPAISLSNDSYSITAIGNDIGFQEIFSRQVESLGTNGDILLAISTSGTSENVINAVSMAKSKGIYCIALIGKDGGKLKDLVDLPILIDHKRTARIQEMHILIIHIICQLIEEKLCIS